MKINGDIGYIIGSDTKDASNYERKVRWIVLVGY
jgi:hypothetical protein